VKDTNGGKVQNRRQRRRWPRARTQFLVWLLFAATAAITFQFARQQPVSRVNYSAPTAAPGDGPEFQDDKTSPALSTESWAVESRAVRPVYRYSLIPGGVESLEELQKAMQRDPVVAKHFQGFDFQRAHLVRVSETQSMHVAYRLGDKVYWTRKKVSLHPGETLISDGKITARTRCGNRVATAPLGAHGLLDPYEGDLDRPLLASAMVTPEVEVQPDVTAAALPTPMPDVANALQPTKNRKRMLPLLFLPLAGFPGGGGSSHEPLAVAPEPGTLLLVSSGLAGVYWRSRKARRKR
jgi:hypothetical protein